MLGIHKGFAGLMDGGKVQPLTLDDVTLIHFRGGSILGTSRTNPSRTPQTLAEAVRNVKALGIDMLMTIGGDDTSYGASEIARHVVLIEPLPRRDDVRVAVGESETPGT